MTDIIPKIDISGLDKVELLKELWDESSNAPYFTNPMTFFNMERIKPPPFDFVLAKTTVTTGYIDYFCGRCIKSDLSEDMAPYEGYNRTVGRGKFQAVIDRLRKRTNSEMVIVALVPEESPLDKPLVKVQGCILPNRTFQNYYDYRIRISDKYYVSISQNEQCSVIFRSYSPCYFGDNYETFDIFCRESYILLTEEQISRFVNLTREYKYNAPFYVKLLDDFENSIRERISKHLAP